MGSVYPRKKKLWLRYKDATGKWVDKSSGCGLGERAKAEDALRRIERAVKDRLARPEGVLGPPTVEVYLKGWIDRRKARVRTWADDETRLRAHVLPFIGHLRMEDVRPRHIGDLIEELRAAGKLAPRTIRNVSGALHSLFQDAVFRGVIDHSPHDLPRGILPKMKDKDPAWRASAVFAREEVERIIGDRRILPDRTVLYAIKFLAGMRHGEVAALTWQRYEPHHVPLGRLLVSHSYEDETKTERPREVPVHPTLAAILEQWRALWGPIFGHDPEPSDLIVPTRGLKMRESPDAQVQFLRDLDTLGMRQRRGHDARRTFVSLALADGADPLVLERVTHGPKGDVRSMYTTYPWETMCKAVAALQIGLASPLAAPLKKFRSYVRIGGDPSGI